MHRFFKFSLAVPALAATLVLSGCPFGPRLNVSTDVLRFDFDTVSQNYETVETFVVSNTGRSELEFTIASDQPWVTVSPASGTAITSETPVTITVTVDREFSELKSADFSDATLTITSNGGDEEVLATVAPDYFTQAFAPGQVDIDGLELTFTPNGGPSFYEATQDEITEFSTDPEDGRAFPLDFGAFGDPVKAGLFGDATVSYYGEEYDTLYISSEGWVSFGEPGNNPTTADDHFEVPQISGLPVDATQAGSVVSYQQDDEKLTITYENAPTKGVPGFGNNFQLNLFFTGEITTGFLDVDPALSGIIGLSNGQGSSGTAPSDFVPSDFTEYNTGELK